MANRHRALGRNRGAWAPNTLYLRGDVVTYQGALYEALDTFTSGGTFDASKWDLILAAPVVSASSLRSQGAPIITSGVGLPPFTGRLANDLHYDLSTGKTLILLGVVGNSVTDSYTYPDFTRLGGKSTETGNPPVPYTTPFGDGSGPRVSNNAVLDSGSGNLALVNLGGGSASVATTHTLNGFTSQNGASLIVGTSANAQSGGLSWSESRGLDVRASTGLVTLPNTNSGTDRYFIGNSTRRNELVWDQGMKVARLYIGGVQFEMWDLSSYTIADGGYAGYSVSTSQGTNQVDDFAALALGTLNWAFAEPIYMQVQLASGSVATGTHILKPGLRVPTFTALREVVLRCDTAPVGSPITVQVERFNGGVSQGIIATVSIAAGATVGSVSGLNAGCAKGDMLKFNITSVGSTTAGSDLTASLDFH